MNALKRMAKKKKTTSSKKPSKPTLVDESLNNNIRDFLEAKKQAKTAKANIAIAEGPIIDAAEKARIDSCTKNGKFESSMKVQSSAGEVTVKFPNRYSKIDPDLEDDLKDVYGEAVYERYFREETEVVMTPEAMEDDQFIQDMMETLGEEKFSKYFDISTHLAPTKSYHEDRVMDAELAKLHSEAIDQGLINPTKPSLTT